MNPFALARPKSFADAAALLAGGAGGKYSLPMLKAGGLDVLDHLKEGLASPDVLIDIKRLRQDPKAEPIRQIGDGDEPRLLIEATTLLSEIVDSTELRKSAPVLSQSLENAASPQVRNTGTAAGNLLQRPRCWYYRNEQFKCLKKGGGTCYAVEGENKYNAILGGGPSHIVHPSNLAPALHVCEATVHTIGGEGGPRAIPMPELYHLPDRGVQSEHNLKKGEVVTHITCRLAPASGFYAIKEKQSLDWPVAFAAAALVLKGDTITSARLCAGAVAPIPWPLPKVEAALKGVNVTDDAALRKACALSVDGAKPLSGNAYKVSLLPVAVRRAILRAAGKPFEPEASA